LHVIIVWYYGRWMIHHPRLGRIIIRIHHERYNGLHVNARLELFASI
jgi:hypothetical protein